MEDRVNTVVDERQRRVGLNEAVFRQVNERIEQVSDHFDLFREELDLVCECGDSACAERISMSKADYEQVRADPLQFAIVPGHEDESVEVVIAREKAYDLVRKHAGEAAALAAERDPRSSQR
jgi:hypothetical protein